MSFIYELVAGRHAEYNEDRLTQIFTALFNKSSGFRQIACEFLEIKDEDNLKAETQPYYKTGKDVGRLDIRIKRNNRIIMIIENKINALLTKKQLDKYDNNLRGIRACPRAVITKWYPDIDCGKWKKYRWSEFYECCINKSNNLSKTDSFLLDEFLKYLEELGMKKVSIISKKKLRDVADVLYHIRSEAKPMVSLGNKQVFETLSNYFKILDDIVDAIKQDNLFKKTIGKNFRFCPWIGSYWEKDEIPRKDLFICYEIKLKKSLNNISKIGTGIRFDSNKKGRYNIITYCSNKNNNFIKEKQYKEINSAFIDEAIDFWRKEFK